MSEALQQIANYERNVLKDLLNQCKPEQIAFFNRMYDSVEVIPKEKIPWAIRQCENTIAKNNSKE